MGFIILVGEPMIIIRNNSLICKIRILFGGIQYLSFLFNNYYLTTDLHGEYME